MEVALFAPLSVGIVPWNGSLRKTVVVKATFSLDVDGEAALCTEPRPLVAEQPGLLSPNELSCADDFAPRKARAEVMLVGHAHASSPASVMRASFSVGSLRRSFYAIAAVPTCSIPLSEIYLREAVAPTACAIRVGPLARQMTSPASREHDDWFQPGFDWTYFNRAPIEQQIDASFEGMAISLHGLLTGTASRNIEIPAMRPHVFIMERGDSLRIQRVSGLHCDTLVIDTDRNCVTLTWRGIGDEFSGVNRQLVVALAPIDAQIDPGKLVERLSLAMIVQAVEPTHGSQFRSDAPVIGGNSSEPNAAAETIAMRAPFIGMNATLPFQPASRFMNLPTHLPEIDKPTQALLHDGAGMTLWGANMPSGEILPFRQPTSSSSQVDTTRAPPPAMDSRTPNADNFVELPSPGPFTEDSDMELHASIQAALWRGDRALGEILDARGIEADDYLIRRRSFYETLNAEVSNGQNERLYRFRETLRKYRRSNDRRVSGS